MCSYLTVFLSRIFINNLLTITKAVANYDDYPLKFYKAKSKFYGISLAPKRSNMFIRIIAAIDDIRIPRRPWDERLHCMIARLKRGTFRQKHKQTLVSRGQIAAKR